MEKPKLYTYFRSSCAYRVRIALNIKGVSYDMIPIHLLKNGGEQKTRIYKQLNPSGQVPALIDNGLLMAQSMSILEYLEETHRNPPLLPQDPHGRAIVRQLCEIVNSGIQPLQNLSVMQFLKDPMKLNDEQVQHWMQHWISRGLESFETLLHKYAGAYCYGDKLSLADCLIVPQIFASKRFKVDMNQFSKMMEINERCLTLTDFIRATPEKQPDYEA